MRTIFVNATVNPTDHKVVQKKVAKAYIADSLSDKEHDIVEYLNKHD